MTGKRTDACFNTGGGGASVFGVEVTGILVPTRGTGLSFGILEAVGASQEALGVSTLVPCWFGCIAVGGGGATAQAWEMSIDVETGSSGAGNAVVVGVAEQEAGLVVKAVDVVPGSGSTEVAEMIGCITVVKLVQRSAPMATFSSEEGGAWAGTEGRGWLHGNGAGGAIEESRLEQQSSGVDFGNGGGGAKAAWVELQLNPSGALSSFCEWTVLSGLQA